MAQKIEIKKKEDGYWLCIDVDNKHAMMNLDFDKRGPLMRSVLQLVAKDEVPQLCAGTYEAMILTTTEKETRCTGRLYTQITWKILSIPFSGYRVYSPLTHNIGRDLDMRDMLGDFARYISDEKLSSYRFELEIDLVKGSVLNEGEISIYPIVRSFRRLK